MAARLLTTEEVAEQLAIAPATIVAWRCTKRVLLPFVKIGRRVRYEPAAVERFVAAQRRDDDEAEGGAS